MTVLRQVQEIVQVALTTDEQSFGGVWIDHIPQFKIIVAFTGQSDRKAFLDRLPPSLRHYVQIRTVQKSLAESQRDLDVILQAINATNIPFHTYFEPRSQNYIIVVKDREAANTARELVPPSLRLMVKVEVGDVLDTYQTNVRSGDAVYGAWDLLNSSGQPTCTYGFVGRDSSGRDSILTAAHCSTTPPYVIGVDGSHLVQLPAATESRYGDLYDFRYHPVVGLQTGYWVYFVNSKPVYQYTQYVNTVSGFHSNGYFTVRDRMRESSYNANPYLGMPVCKSGFTTGFTCGRVVANWVSGTDSKGVSYRGFVKVSGSSQDVVAYGGDSGAPVFSFPNSGYEVVAYGILKGGNDSPTGPCVGSSCWYAYMPIDRVNDRSPFLLHTTQGLLVP